MPQITSQWDVKHHIQLSSLQALARSWSPRSCKGSTGNQCKLWTQGQRHRCWVQPQCLLFNPASLVWAAGGLFLLCSSVGAELLKALPAFFFCPNFPWPWTGFLHYIQVSLALENPEPDWALQVPHQHWSESTTSLNLLRTDEDPHELGGSANI